ncbi:hypothetical protein HAX54_028549 [Datura stramonium]|uniref:Uncharacterized protein n=1 Tax=Datura stramonium TaxID=4076 RepID=A0ABS8V6L1_DATST|nr:hypothetical protein [Datura stramonium]
MNHSTWQQQKWILAQVKGDSKEEFHFGKEKGSSKRRTLGIPATLSLNSFYFISTDLQKRPRKSKIDLGPEGRSRIDSPMGPDFSTTEAKNYSFKSKSKSGRLRWSLFYSCSRDMGIE